jgi:hypothetical protein
MTRFNDHWIGKCIQNNFLNAFSLWFLLFPFDAFILPISIGFMTLYPFLILTFLLLGCSFFIPKKLELKTYLKWALFFFISIAIWGIVMYNYVEGKTEAKFEIRSLIMQALCVTLIFQTFRILGSTVFFKRIFQISIILFIGLCLIGWFEFFTGIHLQGFHTDKILKLPVGNITYTPVFVYDNSNTFLCYLFSLAVIILISKPEKRLRFIEVSSIIFQVLFFSIIADSRFGKLISIALFVFYALSFINSSFISKRINFLKAGAFIFVCTLSVFVFKPVYWGPFWKNGNEYKLNAIQGIVDLNGTPQFIASDSLLKKYGKEKILLAIDTFELQGKLSSNLTRKNLILNGLWMIQQHPIMGLGPGQYSWYTKNKLTPYETGTVDSPHEGLTELTSQYGILFTTYFIFLIVLTFLQFMKQKKINLYTTSQWVFCIGLFWIIAAMPSAWLVLNCGWILIAVLFLSPEKEISASGN